MATSTAYIIKKGDTLWDLAEKYLGDPLRWPEIWHFNNKTYASNIRSKMKPSMNIKNPDLIFIGQQILLPISNNQRQSISASPTEKGNSPAKDKVFLIPYKYEIEKKIFETYLAGGFKGTIKIKGSLTIQSDKPVSWAEFNKGGLDIKVAKEYETPLNKLVSEFQLGINERTKQIDFSCGVTIHSKTSFSPKYQANVSLNPLTGMPKYVTTISYPEVKGKLDSYVYTATGYSVSIEIEKLPDSARRAPRPLLVRQSVMTQMPIKNTGPDWVYTGGILLLVGAAGVIVATIVEDIVTLGVGLADDPASFALAAAMANRGMTLLQGARVSATQLGRLGPSGAALAH